MHHWLSLNPITMDRLVWSRHFRKALSRTFRHRFKDFWEPCLFSRTFQVLKICKKNSRTDTGSV